MGRPLLLLLLRPRCSSSSRPRWRCSRTPSPVGTESRLRRRHRDAIRAAYPHALVVSQPASAFTGAGRTDFYVIVEGKYVGLELKTSTGRATDARTFTLPWYAQRAATATWYGIR